MSDDQTFHFRVLRYLCGLTGGGVHGLFGTGCFGLCEGSFVEKQIHSFYLFDDAWQIGSVRTIGVGTWRVGRSRQASVRDDGSVLGHKIFSVLDAVYQVDGYFVEIYHIPQDVVGQRFLAEQKAAGRESVFQRDGFHRDGTVIVDDGPLLRVERMENHLERHPFAEESQLGFHQPLQFRMAVDVEVGSPVGHGEGGNQSDEAETVVTVQMRDEDMVQPAELQP